MEKSISWKNESGTVEAKYIPMAPDCKTFSQFNESILPHVQQPVKSIDITPFIRVSLFVKFLCGGPDTHVIMYSVGTRNSWGTRVHVTELEGVSAELVGHQGARHRVGRCVNELEGCQRVGR